jgi:hypothetical protein
MEKRNAEAAIAVFTRAENAPTGLPFLSNGGKAIVVFDRKELDVAALKVATLWARWVVRRKLGEFVECDLNVEAVAGLLDQARRALKYHAPVKGCNSTARKTIDEADRDVNSLVVEIEDLIERLSGAIDGE